MLHHGRGSMRARCHQDGSRGGPTKAQAGHPEWILPPAECRTTAGAHRVGLTSLFSATFVEFGDLCPPTVS